MSFSRAFSCVFVVDISNTDFISGRVEDVLPTVLRRVAGQEVVMVVDPPRAGLRMYYDALTCIYYLLLQ